MNTMFFMFWNPWMENLSTRWFICPKTWVGLTLIFVVPPSAQIWLGCWEFGRSGWAAGLGKMVEHPNQSQPNPGLRADESPCTVILPNNVPITDNPIIPKRCHYNRFPPLYILHTCFRRFFASWRGPSAASPPWSAPALRPSRAATFESK